MEMVLIRENSRFGVDGGLSPLSAWSAWSGHRSCGPPPAHWMCDRLRNRQRRPRFESALCLAPLSIMLRLCTLKW